MKQTFLHPSHSDDLGKGGRGRDGPRLCRPMDGHWADDGLPRRRCSCSGPVGQFSWVSSRPSCCSEEPGKTPVLANVERGLLLLCLVALCVATQRRERLSIYQTTAVPSSQVRGLRLSRRDESQATGRRTSRAGTLKAHRCPKPAHPLSPTFWFRRMGPLHPPSARYSSSLEQLCHLTALGFVASVNWSSSSTPALAQDG